MGGGCDELSRDHNQVASKQFLSNPYLPNLSMAGSRVRWQSMAYYHNHDRAWSISP